MAMESKEGDDRNGHAASPPDKQAERDLREVHQVDIAELQEHPLNAEIYGDADGALAASIEIIGILSALEVDRDSMMVLSGHRRLEGARKANRRTVPVVFTNRSDEHGQLAHLLEANRNRVKSEAQEAGEFENWVKVEDERAKKRKVEGGRKRARAAASRSKSASKAGVSAEEPAEGFQHRSMSNSAALGSAPPQTGRAADLAGKAIGWGATKSRGYRKVLMDRPDLHKRVRDGNLSINQAIETEKSERPSSRTSKPSTKESTRLGGRRPTSEPEPLDSRVDEHDALRSGAPELTEDTEIEDAEYGDIGEDAYDGEGADIEDEDVEEDGDRDDIVDGEELECDGAASEVLSLVLNLREALLSSGLDGAIDADLCEGLGEALADLVPEILKLRAEIRRATAGVSGGSGEDQVRRADELPSPEEVSETVLKIETALSYLLPENADDDVLEAIANALGAIKTHQDVGPFEFILGRRRITEERGAAGASGVIDFLRGASLEREQIWGRVEGLAGLGWELRRIGSALVAFDEVLGGESEWWTLFARPVLDGVRELPHTVHRRPFSRFDDEVLSALIDRVAIFVDTDDLALVGDADED